MKRKRFLLLAMVVMCAGIVHAAGVVCAETMADKIRPMSRNHRLYKNTNLTAMKSTCATCAMAMIMKYFGDSGKNQVIIAREMTELIPEYNRKFPDKKIEEKTWPNFNGSYTRMVDYYLQKQGYRTVVKYANYDKKSGRVPQTRFREVLRYLEKEIPVYIVVEGHAVLAVGYDEEKEEIILNDPLLPRRQVPRDNFINRYDDWANGYGEREGWGGEFLVAWK